MQRCTVCLTPSTRALCVACHDLMIQPDFACTQCGKPLTTMDAKHCGECMASPPPFDAVVCASLYQYPMDHWVHQLKFGDRLSAAAVMAEALLPALSQVPKHWPLIPVPLHPKRLLTRGYNQATEVAKIIAKHQHRPLLEGLLIRNKATQMQAELKEKQRQANVAGAFSCPHTIDHPNVLLIDDVMTTGQTLRACAKTLKKSGAQSVTAVVFARSKG